MASEKKALMAQAKSLGIEVEDSDGNRLTVSELRAAVDIATESDRGVELPDEEPVEVVTESGSDMYVVNCTVMLGGRRIDPEFKAGRLVPKTISMTPVQAAPLVRLGHAVKV